MYFRLWRRHAELVKASVWYGLIDYDKEQKLAEEWVRSRKRF